MNWIGKGVLSTRKKYVDKTGTKYIVSGGEIPAGALEENRIKELVELGLVTNDKADAAKKAALEKVEENKKKAAKEAAKKDKENEDKSNENLTPAEKKAAKKAAKEAAKEDNE